MSLIVKYAVPGQPYFATTTNPSVLPAVGHYVCYGDRKYKVTEVQWWLMESAITVIMKPIDT